MTVATQRALDNAIDRCENAGGRGAPANEVRELLRIVRDGKVRLSELVSKHGLTLLNKHKGAMKQDELWLVHEQVAAACLDTGDIQSAKDLVSPPYPPPLETLFLSFFLSFFLSLLDLEQKYPPKLRFSF